MAESMSALRVLRAADEEIEALRGTGADPGVTRGLILRVANAIDRSLRRLLRDQNSVDLSLRLRALAPDEMRSDEVLAELRRCERLPMELAAAVHELFEIRRRLEAGGDPSDADWTRAVRLAEQLAREIEQPTHLPSPPQEPIPLSEPEAEPPRRSRRSGAVPAWAITTALLLVVGLTGIWMIRSGDDSAGIDEGVALFRSGAYADAAQHFWRYAEAHPEDVTPHLYLARIHRRMNRPELAADALRQAQQLAPEDPAVHRELGFLLLDTGRPDVAVGRFRQAIELDETSSEGWIGLIRALRESGREAEVPAVIAASPAEVRALLAAPDTM